MKMLKKIILFGCLLLLFVCCQEETDDWAPLMIYDVEFEPAAVHIGDELTITFAYSDPTGKFSASKVSIDASGDISYQKSGDNDAEYISNKFVSFNGDEFDDNYEIMIDGEKKHVERQAKRDSIYPSRYTYFEDRKVKCIVPENAKSGYIHLSMYSSYGSNGYSSTKLTVLDTASE